MSERVQFETLQRPASPNTYLIAPASLCQTAEPDAPSPLFDMPPADLSGRLKDIISKTEGWTLEHEDTRLPQYEVVARTKVFKFKDDVSLRILSEPEAPGKSRLALYSRSRVGYYDFGANKKRAENLIEELGQDG